MLDNSHSAQIIPRLFFSSSSILSFSLIWLYLEWYMPTGVVCLQWLCCPKTNITWTNYFSKLSTGTSKCIIIHRCIIIIAILLGFSTWLCQTSNTLIYIALNIDHAAYYAESKSWTLISTFVDVLILFLYVDICSLDFLSYCPVSFWFSSSLSVDIFI